ncbi:MAG TPA: hypothetical protein DCW68_03730 [Rhodospirillaceae bacterium]|nr:MAG: hypothetical protein A2018_07810 [Alphaproteobacteria bacterium GWF2_58_20]HAU29204.1 hypothetical protein [Rhodospirillaceae bacterium]
MSSLFDALEKLKRTGSREETNISSLDYDRQSAASMALNITPEPLARLKWRRRILVLLLFVIAPVTVAYVAHVYDETLRRPGSPSLMNRIVAFVSGEDGVKDYVRQGVDSARSVATGVVGNLDKLVDPYGNLPVSDTSVLVPKPPAPSAADVAVPEFVVQEVGVPVQKLPASFQNVTASSNDGAASSMAGPSLKPPVLPGTANLDIDRLIGDLAPAEDGSAFVPTMTGVPLPDAYSPVPDHVELKRGTVPAIGGEDASLSVSYQKSIAMRGLYENAQAALDAGDNLQAMDLFSRILERNRDDEVALFALAVSQQKAGMRKEAMTSYARLLSLEPQNLDAQANRLVLLGQENPVEATARLEMLVKGNPDFVSGWSQLSDLYAQQGNFGAAIAARRQVMSLRPQSLPDLYNLAVLYDRNNDRDAAISAYRAVLRAAGRGGDGLPLTEIRQRLGYLVQ